MPKQARKSNYYYGNIDYNKLNRQVYPSVVTPTKQRPILKPIKSRKTVKKHKNPLYNLVAFCFLLILGLSVIPYSFDRFSKPLLLGANYSEVKVDANEIINSTTNYIYNDLFLNQRMLNGMTTKKPQMTSLYQTQKMSALEINLQKLMAQYRPVDPSVFVWDFSTGKYVDINASKPYAAASIIKIPVLIQLFKSIEANQLTIYDEMTLSPYFVADGSGDLKKHAAYSKYTIDELAKVMIQKSDNSATNMLMAAVGGMPDVNSAIRNWGIKSTYINNWLPDIEGSNYTTAKDLATMLYNLDNPGFLNLSSREYIIDYMSHVENNRLIQAGLPANALFVHKTGDIGKMLGDAGIVFTPNGKKYIVVILANRPYNSPLGKIFINKASSLIYSSVMSGGY